MPQREPIVTVINRVRDADGKPVPYTAYYGGESYTFDDKIQLALGEARVVIHHSMYRLEPDTMYGHYKLGSPELGLPCDPLPVGEVHKEELIDRELLPVDRQLGSKDRFGRTLTRVEKRYRPMRTDDWVAPNPGSGDGAYAGSYGEPKRPT